MVFIWVRFQTRFPFVYGCSTLCTCRHKLFNCLFEIFHFWESIDLIKYERSDLIFPPIHSVHFTIHTLTPYWKTFFFSLAERERKRLSLHKILMETHTKNFANILASSVSLSHFQLIAPRRTARNFACRISFFFVSFGSLFCAYIFSFTYPFVRKAFYRHNIYARF